MSDRKAKECVIKTILITILLLASPMAAHATTVYKCINDEGIPVFSQDPCAKDAERIDINSPRGEIGISASRLSAQKELADLLENQRKSRYRNDKEARGKRSCDPIQSFKLRRLLIQRKLAKCMSKDNVRKVFDRTPSSIYYDSSGEETWYFRLSYKVRTYVYFDPDGLVKGWSGSKNE